MDVTERIEGSVLNVLRREFPETELLGIKNQGRVKEININAGGNEPNVIANRLVNEINFDKQIRVIDKDSNRVSEVFRPEGTAFRVGASMNRLKRMIEQNDDIGFDDLPDGWDEESLDEFARSLTGKTKDDPEGFFSECKTRIQDEEGFDEERANRFCAALKDEYLGTTDWRGEAMNKARRILEGADPETVL